ncbi:hypothetical protein BGX29_007822 [Mortierella sp. GBA35]|nr:hypothetical protein BGX29_007822 [Mortierella sp. GBA35]
MTYPLSTNICCISLHDTDKIRLINVPPALTSPLRYAIFESWDRPIQQESRLPHCGGYEFKLKGRPWSCPSSSDSHIASRKVVLAILRVMETRGWLLILASNVSFEREEKDALFFERVGIRRLMSVVRGGGGEGMRLLPRLSVQDEDPLSRQNAKANWERDLEEMAVVDESESMKKGNSKREENEGEGKGEGGEVELFAIDFSGSDLIRVIEAPVAVITAVRCAIHRHWKQGIQHEEIKAGTYEFKLRGYPFRPRKFESVSMLMMLIQVLENVRLHGFKLCGSMDLNVVGDEEQSIDSWVFRGHRRRRVGHSVVDDGNSSFSSGGQGGSGDAGADEHDGWVVEL